MALNIDGLATYVEENAFEMLSKAVLETNLAQYVQVRAGLQGDAVKIPIMSGEFSPVADTSCGFTDNGDTILEQIPMNLYHAKVNRSYCVKTLRDTFLSRQLSAGAFGGNESLPFEAMAADYFVKNLSKWNEGYLINGDGTANYPGIQSQLATAVTAADPAVPNLNQAKWVSAPDGTGGINALDAVMAIYEEMPDEIALRDDVILVVNPADYKTLVTAMVLKNLYHYAPDSSDLIVPGTNIKVVASSGISSATALNGVYFKFLTSAQNIIMGTDLTSDFDEFKVWYSQDNDDVRTSMKWTVGVALVQPELCVSVNEQ